MRRYFNHCSKSLKRDQKRRKCLSGENWPRKGRQGHFTGHRAVIQENEAAQGPTREKIIPEIRWTEQWSAWGQEDQEDHLCLHARNPLKRPKAAGTDSCPKTNREETVLEFVLYAPVAFHKISELGLLGATQRHRESIGIRPRAESQCQAGLLAGEPVEHLGVGGGHGGSLLGADRQQQTPPQPLPPLKGHRAGVQKERGAVRAPRRRLPE